METAASLKDQPGGQSGFRPFWIEGGFPAIAISDSGPVPAEEAGMARPPSLDLRERVMAPLAAGRGAGADILGTWEARRDIPLEELRAGLPEVGLIIFFPMSS